MNDSNLLSALVEHMESEHNDENILFLIAVKELKAANSRDIDSQITQIYDLYVKQHVEQELNLGQDSRMNILANYQQLDTLSANEKLDIFDPAVDDILPSMTGEVLPRAYKSESFLRKDKKSKQYKALLKAANLR